MDTTLSTQEDASGRAASYQLAEPLLTVQDVSLCLAGRTILDNVSACVRNVTRPGVLQGQVVAIVGPSGVGKTQLFRVLSGLVHPNAGRVLIGPEQRPVECGSVGVVAQDYPLFDHYRVIDNLRLAGRLSGLSPKASDSRCQELLERFAIVEVAQSYPALLSGGQRQRVAIAQQLLRGSRLLLMDEPFSGLDLGMIRQVCALIREVSLLDELFTIVIVSHDIEAVLAVADTIWVLGYSDQSQAGARIVHTLDLMARSLAWRPDARDMAAYAQAKRELEAAFLSHARASAGRVGGERALCL
jgi:ABC-type nitrate/sulfonate/bicarbonate transport system ATPase subunit